jgi:aminoglycoside phosphotransferase (APT) family kinase protein
MDTYSLDKADECTLKHVVEQIVADRYGTPAAVVGLQRRRYEYIGSYDCDLITVQLSSDEELRLFLKDYRVSQKSKDEPELRRERELRVYRDLLSQMALGTPKYYGSVWDEAAGRFWIFLEFVEGAVVRRQDVECGTLAAEWLAEMQGFFHRHPEILSSCDFLIRHDADFFRHKADLALRDVGKISPHSARRLARIAGQYEHVVGVMASQPVTLVHGAYIPWHIVLDHAQEPVRVCPIDWELAAQGATLYDLAFFTDGVEPPTRDRIWDAYRQAAEKHSVPVSDTEALRNAVDCFRLHRIFDWLSRSVEKQFTEKKVARLVDQAAKQSAILHG